MDLVLISRPLTFHDTSIVSPKTDQEKTFITSNFQLAVFSLSIRKFLNIQVAKVPNLVVSSFIPGQVNSKA